MARLARRRGAAFLDLADELADDGENKGPEILEIDAQEVAEIRAKTRGRFATATEERLFDLFERAPRRRVRRHLKKSG